MKRIILFLATNLAVLLVLSVVVSVLGLDRWLMADGIDYTTLLLFSAVMGFGGSFLSLLMSKTIAKWSVGAQVIAQPHRSPAPLPARPVVIDRRTDPAAQRPLQGGAALLHADDLEVPLAASVQHGVAAEELQPS